MVGVFFSQPGNKSGWTSPRFFLGPGKGRRRLLEKPRPAAALAVDAGGIYGQQRPPGKVVEAGRPVADHEVSFHFFLSPIMR